MATVQDLLNIISNIAPEHLAESWDNVGLLIGSPQNQVSSLLLALDPDCAVLEQAQALGCELIITHHPAIFHPLKALRTDRPAGRFIQKALRSGISIIACHTNLDSTPGGVSDALAQLLTLESVTPLVASNACDTTCGLGRIGNLPGPLSAEDFIAAINSALAPPWLLEAGSRPKAVNRVAVCGGSCSDFAETALAAGAEVFLTSEVKHSTARWAEEAGLWLLDGGHFATEQPVITVLQKLLADELVKTHLKSEIFVARQQPPLRLITV